MTTVRTSLENISSQVRLAVTDAVVCWADSDGYGENTEDFLDALETLDSALVDALYRN